MVINPAIYHKRLRSSTRQVMAVVFKEGEKQQIHAKILQNINSNCFSLFYGEIQYVKPQKLLATTHEHCRKYEYEILNVVGVLFDRLVGFIKGKKSTRNHSGFRKRKSQTCLYGRY